jgi:hypothetical protein
VKTIYRTDPETGAVYAWGGVYDLSRTLDEQREQAEDVDRMLLRRLPEIRPAILRARAAASAAPIAAPNTRTGWRTWNMSGPWSKRPNTASVKRVEPIAYAGGLSARRAIYRPRVAAGWKSIRATVQPASRRSRWMHQPGQGLSASAWPLA